MNSRKIIQILQTDDDGRLRITALCNDGTLWAFNPYDSGKAWSKLEDIPQDKPACEDKG